MDDLEGPVSFHGHLCPMFYLGCRMGRAALSSLKREREKGVKLHSVVEFANCFSDGIQYTTGTTFGKNNLHLRDTGKFAASFYDLSSGESLRLRMKNNVLQRVLEYGEASRMVKKLPPGNRAAETKRLMAMGREVVKWLEELTDEELFDKAPAGKFSPAVDQDLKSAICNRCGEVMLLQYAKKNKNMYLCMDCSED